MQRLCTACGCEFRPRDLLKEESKGMERDRKALGLEGVLFRFYHCPRCAHRDLFLDIHPLEGETEEAFRLRRASLEEAARSAARDDAIGVLLVQR